MTVAFHLYTSENPSASYCKAGPSRQAWVSVSGGHAKRAFPTSLLTTSLGMIWSRTASTGSISGLSCAALMLLKETDGFCPPPVYTVKKDCSGLHSLPATCRLLPVVYLPERSSTCPRSQLWIPGLPKPSEAFPPLRAVASS